MGGPPGPLLGPFWLDFEGFVATFSLRMGGEVGGVPLFCWVYGIFTYFGRPGPLLAPCWLDFGGFGAPLWRSWASIFPYFCKIWGGLCLNSFGFIFETFLTTLWSGL